MRLRCQIYSLLQDELSLCYRISSSLRLFLPDLSSKLCSPTNKVRCITTSVFLRALRAAIICLHSEPVLASSAQL